MELNLVVNLIKLLAPVVSAQVKINHLHLVGHEMILIFQVYQQFFLTSK